MTAISAWRAILPHAIANPLAGFALERMPPADFDRFCTSLTARMLKSLSRRLGYLHDSAEARAAVERWLGADGIFGDLAALGEDGLQIFTNIAPVAPEAVIARIERYVAGPRGAEILDPQSSDRWQWIRLILNSSVTWPARRVLAVFGVCNGLQLVAWRR